MENHEDWQMWKDYLFTASRILATAEAKLQADSGMSLSDYDILVSLYRAQDHTLSMSCLKETVLVTTSGLSRSVSRLVQRGWIEKHPHETDGRQIYIGLTPDGRAAFEAANPSHISFVRETFFAALSKKDQDGLRFGLAHLADHVRN